MTRNDLERLERAGMIYNLQENRHGFEYYDVEAETRVMAIYDVSDETISKLQANYKHIKLRRIERD